VNQFITDVVSNVLQQFSPAALVAVILVNLVVELIQRIRRPARRGHALRETLAFCAVMAVMTAWAFIALAAPVGVARIENLNAASPWLILIGLLIYLAGAFPLGLAMFELLLAAQCGDSLARHEQARRRRPTFVFAYLFKVGVAAIAMALLVFPALAAILPGAPAVPALLLQYTVVAFLLADTVCYGWILVAE
jgi:hypothetical protein